MSLIDIKMGRATKAGQAPQQACHLSMPWQGLHCQNEGNSCGADQLLTTISNVGWNAEIHAEMLQLLIGLGSTGAPITAENTGLLATLMLCRPYGAQRQCRNGV